MTRRRVRKLDLDMLPPRPLDAFEQFLVELALDPRMRHLPGVQPLYQAAQRKARKARRFKSNEVRNTGTERSRNLELD